MSLNLRHRLFFSHGNKYSSEALLLSSFLFFSLKNSYVTNKRNKKKSLTTVVHLRYRFMDRIESKPICLLYLDENVLRNISNFYDSSCEKSNFSREEIFPAVKHVNSSRHIILIDSLKQLSEYTQLSVSG